MREIDGRWRPLESMQRFETLGSLSALTVRRRYYRDYSMQYFPLQRAGHRVTAAKTDRFIFLARQATLHPLPSPPPA